MGMKTGRKLPHRSSVSPNFKGMTLKESRDAVVENIKMLRKSSDSIYEGDPYSMVEKACLRFLDNFYLILKSKYPDQIRSFAEACEVRSKDLIHMKDQLAMMTNVDIFAYVPKGKEPVMAGDIRYYSRSSLYCICDGDEYGGEEVFTQHRKPRFYSPLFWAGVKLFAMFFEERDDIMLSQDYLALYNILISCSKIYVELNPSKKDHVDMAKSTLDLLKNRSLQTWNDDLVNAAFYEVVSDIWDGDLPYIQEFYRAIQRSADFRHSPYNDKDDYVSMKASPAHSVYKDKQSILKSTWEIDPFKGHPMDSKIGYQSNYNESPPEGWVDRNMLTLMIENPSKFKLRAIHLALNAIQDRGNYIHRRLNYFLGLLPNDCTKNQERGVRFIKRITSERFRDQFEYPSMFNADFSNATDTLDQRFQEECLGILFPEEVSKFWGDISKMDKDFLVDPGKGRVEHYTQLTGQPQGILGSFDAFALAHHIMFLITMKLAGYEDYKASQCYVVLGDDSAATAFDPGVDLIHIYERVVTNFGLIFNSSKAGYTASGPGEVARLDFAKVTVLNGIYDTPIPSRIFFRTRKEDEDLYYRIAVITWLHSHGRDMKTFLTETIFNHFKGEEAKQDIALKIVKGGFAPVFDSFTDLQVIDEVEPEVLYAYLINKVQSTFVEVCLSDKVKEDLNLSGFSLRDAIEEMLPKKKGSKKLIEYDGKTYFDFAENEDHKFYKVISNNLIVEDALRTITGIDDVNWALAAASLYLEEDEVKTLIDLSSIAEDYAYTQELPSQNELRKMIKDLEKLSRFEMRSVTKRLAKTVSYFDNIIDIVLKLKE